MTAKSRGSEMLRDLRNGRKILEEVHEPLQTALHTVEAQHQDFEGQQLSWRSA
jgi:hypothetical protein